MSLREKITDPRAAYHVPRKVTRLFSIFSRISALGSRFLLKPILSIHFRNEALYLHISCGNHARSERIFLRETSEETVAAKAASFLHETKPRETLLIISRSEVIQKELVLSNGNGSLKQTLEAKLGEILPYPAKEMAYGFSLEQNAGAVRGLLTAIPEKHLSKTLDFLKRIGLDPDEIITEDQALHWLCLERKENTPLLHLDLGDDRILALASSAGRLRFSKLFSLKSPVLNGQLEDVLQEISLCLLETGEKPSKILLSGSWEEEAKRQVASYFKSPAECLALPQTEIPSSIFAGRLLGRFTAASLLPREKKIERIKKDKEKQYRELGAGFLLLFTAVSIVFFTHLLLIQNQGRRLEREIQRLAPPIKEVKQIEKNLKSLEEARNSKLKALDLLKTLSERSPSSIRFNELRLEEGEFFLKAESPSHGLMTEMVSILEKVEGIKNPKLDKTRLRKKLSQEYFEFEIRGDWKA